MDEFTSPYLNEVWKFFADLRQKPEVYETIKALPEPKSKIAYDCLQFVKKIRDDSLSSEEKDKIEREFILLMSNKYPRHEWKPGRKANL